MKVNHQICPKIEKKRIDKVKIKLNKEKPWKYSKVKDKFDRQRVGFRKSRTQKGKGS